MAFPPYILLSIVPSLQLIETSFVQSAYRFKNLLLQRKNIMDYICSLGSLVTARQSYPIFQTNI